MTVFCASEGASLRPGPWNGLRCERPDGMSHVGAGRWPTCRYRARCAPSGSPMISGSSRRAMRRLAAVLASLTLLAAASRASAQEEPTSPSLQKIAKQARNPLPDAINIPIMPTFNFGPGHVTQFVLEIQPVIPFHLPNDWNLVTRTDLTVIHQPGTEPGQGGTFGFGDTVFEAFVSPPSTEALIWGVGPLILFPTASADVLGAGKWGMGPTAAAIYSTGPWELGLLVNNVWSFAGDRTRPPVKEMSIDQDIQYSWPSGWYLTYGPTITADWTASSSDRWTVPVGAGVGKALEIGELALNLQVEAYDNVVRPAGTSTWSLILTLQFVFPETAIRRW